MLCLLSVESMNSTQGCPSGGIFTYLLTMNQSAPGLHVRCSVPHCTGTRGGDVDDAYKLSFSFLDTRAETVPDSSEESEAELVR